MNIREHYNLIIENKDLYSLDEYEYLLKDFLETY